MLLQKNFSLIRIADNGLNPTWNENCEFEVKFPDIALIRFVVQDEDMFGDTNFIGQATYPVSVAFLFFHRSFRFAARKMET